MKLKIFCERRSVGLKNGSGFIKTLVEERRGSDLVVTRRGMTAVARGADSTG